MSFLQNYFTHNNKNNLNINDLHSFDTFSDDDNFEIVVKKVNISKNEILNVKLKNSKHIKNNIIQNNHEFKKIKLKPIPKKIDKEYEPRHPVLKELLNKTKKY